MDISFCINGNLGNLTVTTETRKQKPIFEEAMDVAEIQPEW